MNKQAFLRTICDQPAEDGPKLVFTDWLEEQGSPWAELIRVSVETRKETHELIDQYGAFWAQELMWQVFNDPWFYSHFVRVRCPSCHGGGCWNCDMDGGRVTVAKWDWMDGFPSIFEMSLSTWVGERCNCWDPTGLTSIYCTNCYGYRYRIRPVGPLLMRRVPIRKVRFWDCRPVYSSVGDYFYWDPRTPCRTLSSIAPIIGTFGEKYSTEEEAHDDLSRLAMEAFKNASIPEDYM